MPAKIDDVDAGWLTAALASRIWAGAEVQSFSVATIGTGVGLMGLLYRLTIEYAGDPDAGAPRTVIVKLPVLIDATREVALAYRFYEKEVAFYRDLAHETPLRTPEVYFAAHDLDTDNFVLVMQDLGHLRTADQVAGCDRDDAVAAVAALARHHAAFWNDPRLENDELTWIPFGSDAPIPEGVVQGFTSAWDPFIEFIGHDLSPEI